MSDRRSHEVESGWVTACLRCWFSGGVLEAERLICLFPCVAVCDTDRKKSHGSGPRFETSSETRFREPFV